MSKMSLILRGLATVALAAVLSGCGGGNKGEAKPDAAKPDAAKQSSQTPADAHAGHNDAGGKYAEALAKLSPEDRAAAEKQQTCPVTGEPLGSMGAPYKVEVKGRTVFLCCPGCEEKIKANPDKYLAKLDKN